MSPPNRGDNSAAGTLRNSKTNEMGVSSSSQQQRQQQQQDERTLAKIRKLANAITNQPSRPSCKSSNNKDDDDEIATASSSLLWRSDHSHRQEEMSPYAASRKKRRSMTGTSTSSRKSSFTGDGGGSSKTDMTDMTDTDEANNANNANTNKTDKTDTTSNSNSNNDDNMMPPEEVDRIIIRAGIAAILLWLTCLCCVYTFAPEGSIVYLSGHEQRAASMAFMALLFSILLTLIPYSVGSQLKSMSGVLIAAIIVQGVAMVTNAIMAFGPTVVIVDRVTLSPVYLTRWCEWTPLAGFMTLMSEVVDLSADPHKRRRQYMSAFVQLTSAGCGLFFVFCPNTLSWTILMTLSCVTWAQIFPRITIRRNRLKEHMLTNNTTVDSEHLERLQFSYRLILCCGCMWTFLVVIYFLNMHIHIFTPEDHAFRIPGLPMIIDTTFDLVAKILYMKIISSVHDSVFDAGGRVRRRLQELRHMLSVLWESSSDSIVISVGNGSRQVSTMLSPTYSSLVGLRDPEQHMAIVVEAELEEDTNQLVPQSAYFVHATMPFDMNSHQKTVSIDLQQHFIIEAMQVINAVWNCKSEESVLDHDVITYQRSVAKCEIKVTRQTDNAVIGMVRDATERFLLGEAEQRAIMETQARQKDAQAVNRFTRHEVKNGLLASIELCDCLRTSVIEPLDDVSPTETGRSLQVQNRVEELDRALHEILDTVLAEAMARDVIHGVYRPKLERLNVMVALQSALVDGGNRERFVINAKTKDLSFLALDPQLLRYIHRNAVSNGCKYGQENGQITTEVSFDLSKKEFQMDVINLPGPNHDELVVMGSEAAEGVFKQGKRLHAELKMDKEIVSSGDGAWIMSKCAKTLKGVCSIRFYPDKTVFTFRCPSQQYQEVDDARRPWGSPMHFTVPEGTWAVAVDDSLIQRKLLGKILEQAGVPKDHCILLGKSSSEIRGFQNSVRHTLDTFPESKILILMDENLEMVEDGRQVLLSGSNALHEMLEQLEDADESRILALVRSANDSGEDVEIYTNRSHGVFPKAPMKQDRVRELLASLWTRRFDDELDEWEESSEEEEAIRKDVAKALFFASSLISDGVTVSRWPQIWGALWDLKDKLLEDYFPAKVHAISELIGGMQKTSVPSDFEFKWNLIRQTVDESVLKNW